LGLFIVPSVLAETAPDAGKTQRQLEQTVRPLTPKAKRPRDSAPLPLAPKPGEVAITVRQFEVTGAQGLSVAQLNEALAPFLNRPLGFSGLQLAADAVVQAYAESGRLARAFLPRQDIENGLVRIEVVEARIGQVRIEGSPLQRIAAQRLIAPLTQLQKPGQPLDTHAIDRLLLLLDDLPGVSVAGRFEAGAVDGETDIVLSVSDESLWRGTFSIDNQGSSSMGMNRASATLEASSPLKIGDALNLTLLKSEGNAYVRANWSAPLGVDGMRAGAHASRMDYQLIGDFASLDGHGSSGVLGLDMSYPFLRSNQANVNFLFGFEDKRFENYSNASLQSRYGVQTSTLSLNANRFDSLWGGGANSLGVSWVDGFVNLGDSPNQSTDALGAQTQGNFQKMSINLARQQAISRTLSANVAWSFQTSSKNLDSSERFYLGGASGVRAYPSSEAGGSSGQMFNIELRQRLDERWTLTGFYDEGQVEVYRVNADALSGSAANRLTLAGYGLAVLWQGPEGWDVKAALAQRATGFDNSNAYALTRFWLSANWGF
jgi:hemolysin activation/secretion protein